MNEKSFQLLGAGLDDNFGNVVMSGGGPRYYTYPSGNSIDFSPVPSNPPIEGAYSRFLDSANDATKYQYDNVANFADGLLSDALPN